VTELKINHMKNCQECNRPVVGRADKRYCDDYCRSSYHNKRYRGLNKEVQEVNSILKNNRKVLAKLCIDEMSLVSRTQLVAEGFDFKYATSVEKFKDYNCRYCYEFGVVSLGASMCGVIMKDG